MKNMISKVFIAFVLMSSLATFAASTCTDSCMPEKPKKETNDCCKPCCTETPSTVCPTTPAYNAPARVDIACGWDAFISASFLYMQPIEQGMEVAYQNTSTVGAPTINKLDEIDMDFDWTPAFKVALGFSSDRDDWKLMLEYMRINTSSSRAKNLGDAAGSDVLYLGSPWFDHSPVLQSRYASNKWKLDLNLFDLELSRPYYLGQELVFNPFIGMRGGWIDQKADAKIIDIETSTDTFSTTKSDSWLIGFRAGLDTCWMIGEGFRLFGDIAGSLVYQDYDLSHTETYATTINKGSNSKFYITPNFEIALGLGYGTYFSNDEWYVDLAIGYEFHAFLNQNQMRAWNEKFSSLNNTEDGDLFLHGLNVSLRFDF